MKLSIFDLKETEEKVLAELVEETMDKFPILKNIYSEEFLQNIIKKRYNFDNYLLWLLASKEPYAILTWEEVSKSLSLLDRSDVIVHFKEKLSSTGEYVFRSYQTELDYATYYKEKGYDVELEPSIPGSHKKPEFKIESDKLKVYFEAKNIFWEEIMQMHALTTQIQGALGRIDELLVFSVFYSSQLTIGQVPTLRKFVLANLKTLGPSQLFPRKFVFERDGDLLAKIVVYGKPRRLFYGYLGALQPLQALKCPTPEVVRNKISKKVSQLPEDEANVIVIEPGVFGIDNDTVISALYGSEFYVLDKDGGLKGARKRNGLYQPNKNTRVGGVIFSDKRLDNKSQCFFRRKYVFHNPFAKKALETSFFKDNKVEQFVPVENAETVRMDWA